MKLHHLRKFVEVVKVKEEEVEAEDVEEGEEENGIS